MQLISAQNKDNIKCQLKAESKQIQVQGVLFRFMATGWQKKEKSDSFSSVSLKPPECCSLLYARECVQMKAPYGPVGCVLKHHSWVTVSHIIGFFSQGNGKLWSRDQREGRTHLSYHLQGTGFWKDSRTRHDTETSLGVILSTIFVLWGKPLYIRCIKCWIHVFHC